MASRTPTAKQASTGHKDGREVEWQMACSDLGAVHRWLTEHTVVDGLLVEPHSPLEILDTYLDTEDWRLHRAGFALRLRSASGSSEATLKALRSASAKVADRREVTEPLEGGEADWPRESEGPVGVRVRAVTGTHALRPLFEVRTFRQRFIVRRQDEGGPLGEIDLDATVIHRPRGEPTASLQRVEVEALTDAHAGLRALVLTLRTGCGLQTAGENKYSLGLTSVGLAPEPPPEFTPTSVAADMPMLDVALANLRRDWSAWQRHEPAARLGDDPEEMHELRVAGRRLDAVLRQFRRWLPESARAIRKPLKKVLRAFGEVRDLDVALHELARFSRGWGPDERQDIAPLQHLWASERDRARSRMLRLVDSVAVQGELAALTALLSATPSPSPAPAALSARNQAPGLLRRRYRKMHRAAVRLSAESSARDHHRLRSHVKNLRYALDAVAVLYGKPADDLLRALRRWQAILGAQQDAAVAGRRLHALAAAPPKGMMPRTLFLMGRFAEHYGGAAAKAAKFHAKGHRRVKARWKDLRSEFEAP